jgi:transposase InsO family protein
MSRENYYECRRQRQERKVDQDLIVTLVREQRQMHPRMGCRKLLYLLRLDLDAAGVKVGRDRLFGILRDQDLLVEPKRGQPRTTNSRHSLPVFHNRVAEMTLTGPNQAWAADLTYVRTEEGFLYAAMITDMYSRKIVGRRIGDTLEAVGCLEALDGALAALPADQHPVHHSDRGCQFCCHLYVERLQERGLPVSMTEVLHCYENALAERVNGIIKQEYELDRTFRTKEQAIAAFEQAVWLYNHRRPHLALDYRTPAEVHAQAA